MSTSFSKKNQSISGRFNLVQELGHQLPYPGVRMWIAHDTVLSHKLRAIVLDPDSDQSNRVLDAARRTALIDNPNLVSIVSVVDDGETKAILTEIPPGTPLSAYLGSEPLDPNTVHSLVGELSSVINMIRHRGVRHLQPNSDSIYLTDSGSIIVDGFGTHAALANVDVTRASAELDREEARGLTVFLASLLLGQEFPNNPDDHEPLIGQAAQLNYLPDVIAETLTREQDSDGALSPGDFMRRLAPWSELRLHELEPVNQSNVETELFPIVEDSAESQDVSSDSDRQDEAENQRGSDPSVQETAVFAPSAAYGTEADADGESDAKAEQPHETSSPATTKEEAIAALDRALGISDEDATTEKINWPSLRDKAGRGATVTSATQRRGRNETPQKSQRAKPTEPAAKRTEPETKAPQRKSVLLGQAAEPIRQIGGKVVQQTAKLTPLINGVGEQAEAAVAKITEGDHDPNVRKFNPSKIVVSVFAIGVIFVAFWAVSMIKRPLDPVQVTSEGGYIPLNSEAPEEGKGQANEPNEPSDPIVEVVPPVVADIKLVNPDAGLIRGTDPLTQDNPRSVGNAIDNNPGTYWATWSYTDPLMRPMTGIGLAITLEEESDVTELTLYVNGEGGNIQWRDTVVEAPGSGKLVAESAMSSEFKLTAEEPIRTDTVILWITEQPKNNSDGANKTEINEIKVG